LPIALNIPLPRCFNKSLPLLTAGRVDSGEVSETLLPLTGSVRLTAEPPHLGTDGGQLAASPLAPASGHFAAAFDLALSSANTALARAMFCREDRCFLTLRDWPPKLPTLANSRRNASDSTIFIDHLDWN